MKTEAQRLREVEALRLKDGETFDVNKYDLNELETIRKNNPGVDLKIDADNNRIVASKNERYTYDVEFAEAKNSVKAKGAEAVQQIIDEVGEIDANKSFSDIAKESQKNGKASNSRDVYSDSHAQQIMDEIANVREDIKNKGTEDAKKIFDDIANIDANKSFSDIAKEAQKNGKTSNSRELKSGKSDFAAAGMSITEERKKQVDFTIEYVTSNQVVVVKKDSSLNDITQLDGKRIAVQQGTVGDSYVTDNYKNSEINRQKKFLVAAEAVKNNKADCIVMDQIPAQQLVNQNPELKILDGILFKDSYGMAVKKGNTELLDTMNTVLQRLIDEGKIEEYIIEYSK